MIWKRNGVGAMEEEWRLIYERGVEEEIWKMNEEEIWKRNGG